MKVRLLKYWEKARSSYWFIPTVMVLGAIVASFAMVKIDSEIGTGWLGAVPWLYENRPSGARELLSSISTSMITVAGVTFSITIAAVAYAASQFGPRLLTNFMRDRGNQVTLGTFIATFLYCLLVLRTIRGAEEGVGLLEGTADVFVPHLSILFGIILTLASVGVFIYFIHHIPESIHATNVIADIGHELNRKIDSLFPALIGSGLPVEDGYEPQKDVPADFFDRSSEVRANGSGYVQYIDQEGLLGVARDHDLLVRLQYRPGDFVTDGKVLVLAYPEENLTDEVAHRIRTLFAWGRQRTHVQDILFLANELIEIAMRALSPSLNDPFTAMTCIDWLGSAASNFSEKDVPTAFRYDDDQRLRVIARPITFEFFIDSVFDRLRPYVTGDENASLHVLKVMAEITSGLKSEPYRQLILKHATIYRDVCLRQLDAERVQRQIEERYRVVARLARSPGSHREIVDEEQWLEGSS